VLDLSGGGGVLTWTMRFDPVNAIDPEFLSAMESALDAAIGDESVAVVVIASGLEVFSAGAAANWIGQVARERGLTGLLTEFNHTMDRFRDFCVRMRKATCFSSRPEPAGLRRSRGESDRSLGLDAARRIPAGSRGVHRKVRMRRFDAD
jgi:hypothetical protein